MVRIVSSGLIYEHSHFCNWVGFEPSLPNSAMFFRCEHSEGLNLQLKPLRFCLTFPLPKNPTENKNPTNH